MTVVRLEFEWVLCSDLKSNTIWIEWERVLAIVRLCEFKDIFFFLSHWLRLHKLPPQINPGHGYGGVVALDGKNIKGIYLVEIYIAPC